MPGQNVQLGGIDTDTYPAVADNPVRSVRVHLVADSHDAVVKLLATILLQNAALVVLP